MAKCVFCDIVAGKIISNFLYETEQLVVFADTCPQAPQHCLIVPKKHIVNINAVKIDDAALLGHMLITAKEIANMLAVAHSGYRLIFNVNHDGGQTVPHIHLHLLAGRQMAWPPG